MNETNDRVVRTCQQHHVPLIKDTLTCPKGNHQVRRWGTVERHRMASTKPRFLGAADVDDKELVGADVPLKETRVEEKKPGVYNRVKYQDAGENVLWLHLRKRKIKAPGTPAWRVTWWLKAKTGSARGTAAVSSSEDEAREAFAKKRKAYSSQGWEETFVTRGLRVSDPPPPPKPVKRAP